MIQIFSHEFDPPLGGARMRPQRGKLSKSLKSLMIFSDCGDIGTVIVMEWNTCFISLGKIPMLFPPSGKSGISLASFTMYLVY